MKRRFFVSTNFSQLLNVLEPDELLKVGIVADFEVLYFHIDNKKFCQENEKSEIIIVHNNLPEIPIDINKESDYLLYHSETKRTKVLDQFFRRNLREDNHSSGRHYKCFFDSIILNPEKAADYIFTKIFEIDQNLCDLLEFFKFLDPRVDLKVEGKAKLQALEEHVQLRYSQNPTNE